MSVYSMTGFGKGECSGKNFVVTVEIKTVNNRFKDMRFRMGSLFNSIELELRNKIDEEFKRGTFDVNISYKKNEVNSKEFLIDNEKIKSFLDLTVPHLKKQEIPFTINPSDFLRSDFLKDDEELKEKEILPLMWSAFDLSLQSLKESRKQEGTKLVAKLVEHLSHYEKCLKIVDTLKVEYPNLVRDRLTQKLNEKMKDFKIDESRLMQEIVYYLEKLEVDEEIHRAKIHVQKLKTILNSTGEVGRQIDFLLQELGRETNTLGSKSAHSEISSQVIEMKVQLEKIREQALNLE
jgi:uncharacterized protein (TIGR00255 family)